MIYKLIHKNSLLPFVLLPFLMVAFWGKTLFLSNVPFASPELPMPLCELVNPLVYGRPLISALISLFAAFLVMVGLNRFNSKYSLLKRQSLISGFVYLVFVSGYGTVQQLHPVWFFAPLFVFAVDRLFSAAMLKETSVELFNAALLVSLSSLFYAKALFFAPLVWWILALLNIMSFRGFLATLLGFLTPWAVTAGIYFYQGRLGELMVTFHENLIGAVAFFDHSILSKIYNGFLIAFIFVAIVVVIGKISSMKIINRKLHRVFIAIVSYGIVLAATPFFSMEIIPIVGIGASVLLAQLFDSFKKGIWQETFFAVFVGFTVLVRLLGE